MQRNMQEHAEGSEHSGSDLLHMTNEFPVSDLQVQRARII